MTEAPNAGRRLLHLFATPVIIDELEAAAELNAELEAVILARMESDPGLRLSNQGGWQSSHDLHAWAGEAGKHILAHAAALATANTAADQGTGIRWAVDAWANVSTTGAANRAHVHGGSFWSAVYYVRVGSGEGGGLVLHDPRMPALRMHAPSLRFKDCGSEVFASIQPKAGLMVLFPAWLSHAVEPWQGDQPRISIVMNIRAVPAIARSELLPISTPNPDKDKR